MDINQSTLESTQKSLTALSLGIIVFYVTGASVGAKPTVEDESTVTIFGGTFSMTADGVDRFYVCVVLVFLYLLWRYFTLVGSISIDNYIAKDAYLNRAVASLNNTRKIEYSLDWISGNKDDQKKVVASNGRYALLKAFVKNSPAFLLRREQYFPSFPDKDFAYVAISNDTYKQKFKDTLLFSPYLGDVVVPVALPMLCVLILIGDIILSTFLRVSNMIGLG